jgi:light-harvesting complex 1 beta chain
VLVLRSLINSAGTVSHWDCEKMFVEGISMAEQSISGLTVEQAKEFHEQFKVTYTAFVGIAAVAHLLVIAWKPWF